MRYRTRVARKGAWAQCGPSRGADLAHFCLNPGHEINPATAPAMPIYLSRTLASVSVALAFALSLSTPVAAQSTPADSSNDKWTFAITPYLWLPNVNGSLKYEVPPGAGGAPEVETGPNSYLSNLQFLLMVAGEARYGKWSIFTDLVALDFANEDGNVKSVDFDGTHLSAGLDLGTQSTLRGAAWSIAGGYTVAQTPDATLDLIGGLRYFTIKGTADWNLSASISGPGSGQTFPRTGGVSKRADLYDAIIGVRGRIKLGDSGAWSLPYYLDIGTGSSTITTQALVGVSYTFGWGDLSAVYKTLYYDQPSDQFVQSLRFSGPAVGATFRF